MADEKNSGIIFLFSDINGQVIGCHNQTRAFFPKSFLNFASIVKSPVHFCTKVRKGKTFCMCFFCNPDGILRVEMRPPGAFLPGFQSAFGNQKIRISGERDCVVAETSIGTVGDYLAVNGQPEPITRCRVYEREALNRERDGMLSGLKFHKTDGVRKLCERDGERLCNKCIQDGSSPNLPEDL
jgi:hypothetical protein